MWQTTMTAETAKTFLALTKCKKCTCYSIFFLRNFMLIGHSRRLFPFEKFLPVLFRAHSTWHRHRRAFFCPRPLSPRFAFAGRRGSRKDPSAHKFRVGITVKDAKLCIVSLFIHLEYNINFQKLPIQKGAPNRFFRSEFVLL